MHIILEIISAFVFATGALTFRASSEEAAETHDYNSLGMSSIMIIVGDFCFLFFAFNLAAAALGALLCAIALFAAHTVISRRLLAETIRIEKGHAIDDDIELRAKHSKIANAQHVADAVSDTAPDDACAMQPPAVS